MIEAQTAAERRQRTDTRFDRQHTDPYAGDAPPLEVDRRRIIHSAAFRRLQYKTQVFVITEGDHYRTRLTHTLEVAELSRTLARRLGCDAELAEVVALAHDLGHPPFGHAGEKALAACLRAHGGFEHNRHALRVVEVLEHPYPEFRGLNLVRVVRECLAKHSTRYDAPADHPLRDGLPAPREGQIADLADRLAYCLHDLQDALYSRVIEPDDLSDVPLWRAHAGPGFLAGNRWRSRLRAVIDRLRETLISDVVSEAQRGGGEAPLRLSARAEGELRGLEEFLLERVYRDSRLARMDAKARRVLTAVYEAYVAEPALMPRRFAQRVAEQGAPRVAADYIAGMTDRFCLGEHARLFDPHTSV